jgi:PKD repeat protein
MTIPNGSNYPAALDTDDNMFLVHDSLRVTLAQDYNPGDTSITVSGDLETMSRFPPTGLITLTEQCSDPKLRAISFYYKATDNLSTFSGLELLEGFTDNPKPALITDVTQNVMDKHHNSIKDAVIAIQQFAGKKGEVGTIPLEGTMEARINYLRNLVLIPKAWMSANTTIGLVPFTVEFTDQSFRLGTDGTSHSITRTWDFGDNNGPSEITISQTATGLPCPSPDITPPETISHTYTTPGIYDVTLTITNDFGSDTVVFPSLINARVPAPDFAVINFTPRSGQIFTPGSPIGGPYITTPIIRSPTNTIITLDVPQGINGNTGESYAGETLDGAGHPIDPITAYTWSLADDLQHNNSMMANASYSVGGLYDLILRVDTEFGAYRITKYPAALDIVERDNLWFWSFSNIQQVYSFEFGLFSETFKNRSQAALNVNYNDSFLSGAVNSAQQLREFHRNNGFAQRGSIQSGLGGTGLLYWASGRNATDSPALETIQFSEFNGFADTYTARSPINRPWNWVSLVSQSKIYFLLGGVTTPSLPNTSPTNQRQDALLLSNLSVASVSFGNSNYKNGANELMQNEVTYDISGNPLQGNMSVYRSCWKDSAGYFLRNEGTGAFFRMAAFYKTNGNTTEPFQFLYKLPDMAGPAKVEGQLVTLSQGVFFFNNSGSVSAYNPTSAVWEVGGPGANSAAFRSFQDTNVLDFDDPANTLLATSDNQQVAYLSYDYSTNAFIKFNAADLTFSSVVARPSGTQWQMTIF